MIQGVIEALSATYIGGWAFEDSSPGQPLEVRVLLERREIARADADMFRQDLADAGIGNGRHGFHAPIPDGVAQVDRARLEVRAVDALGRFRPLPWLAAAKPLHFGGPTSDAESRPVFILGSPRSGTSAMAAALRGATRYEGYDEGHLFSLLPRLMDAVALQYRELAGALSGGTMLATVPRSDIEARLRALFIDLARERFATPFWIDKTPSNHMIAAAPLLAAMWPNGRFIFMKRRGIENIASRLRKFSDATFEAQCRDWADAMLLWSGVRVRIGERGREVDQFALAREPDRIADELAEFLDLPAAERAPFRESLARLRTEQTGARVDSTIGLARSGWTPEQQTMFRAICGPAMFLYGYSEAAGG